MSKTIVQRLAAAITPGPPRLTTAELMDRRSAAEASLSAAETEYRRAALAVEEGEEGAIARKAEAAGTVRAAQERVRDIMSAAMEHEAAERERTRLSAQAAFAKVQDTARAALDAQAKVDGELVKAFDTFANAIKRAVKARTNTAKALQGLHLPNDYFPAAGLLEIRRFARILGNETHRVELPLETPSGAATLGLRAPDARTLQQELGLAAEYLRGHVDKAKKPR